MRTRWSGAEAIHSRWLAIRWLGLSGVLLFLLSALLPNQGYAQNLTRSRVVFLPLSTPPGIRPRIMNM